MIDRLLCVVVERLIDDQTRAILAGFGPSEVHRERHVQDLERRRVEPDVEWQAFAAPGFFFKGEEAGDQIIVVFEARPALLLDPADREFERHAGLAEKHRNQREMDRHRLADEVRGFVTIEVVEQHRKGSVGIDAVLADQDPRRRR